VTAAPAPLLVLVYVSTAMPALSRAELDELVAGSRRRNAAAGITGLLLYADGSVLQALEGPEDAVSALFGRIGRDPRHRGVSAILRRPLSRRIFADWTMACEVLGARERLPPALHARLSLLCESADPVARGTASVVLRIAEGMRLGEPVHRFQPAGA
jgi:hypothetical protein